MKLLLTALSLLAVGQGAPASKNHKLRELRLTKPPLNTTCSLEGYVLFPTQAFFKQNEGGFIKLTITNPLDVPIEIASVSYSVTSSPLQGLSPPNTPNINYTRDGGMFLYETGQTVDGIINKYTRVAKQTRGVPVPIIAAHRRSVTWPAFTLAPRQKAKLVVQVRYGPGIRRSTPITATVTYPKAGGGTCSTRSNTFGLQAYISPVTSIRSVYNGKTLTYQQYASVYRVCRKNVGFANFTTVDNCASLCNANPECQAFVMQRPSDTWNNMTCLLYDGNPGSSKTFQYSDAQGNITTNRFGATIFLRWKNPTVFIPPGNPCNWN